MYCRSHDWGVCIQMDLPAVGGGVCIHAKGGLPPGGLHPGGFASKGDLPLEGLHPGEQTPHRYYSIQSTGWRYASHWNAFLFDIVLFCCCLGLASATVPMYIAECTLPHNRGRLVTIFNTCGSEGDFFSITRMKN